MIGKLKYVGETFSFGLTNGRIYDCTEIDENGLLRVVDDDSWGDDSDGYLYSAVAPGPLDGSSPGGRWEIVNDNSGGRLQKLIPA